MLRSFVLGLGILLTGTGVVGLTLDGGPAMLAPLTFGVLLLLGTIFEPHYKRVQPAPVPRAGFTPTKIETHAAVTLAKVGEGFSITKITLDTTADVPGATKEAFDTAAANAKAGCPISKLFANNTEIVLDAKLV